MNESTREYEFESIGESTIRETWRASAPAELDGDDLAHFLEDEMREGRAEFVDESNEDECGRELVEGSIEPAPPRTEPAYTVIGVYIEGDSFHQRYATTVYTHNGPEAAEALAQAACREDNQAEDGDDLIEIAAVIEGEVTVAA